MKLHFGVTDLPYSQSVNLGRTKSGKTRVATTGEVADILESKYGIMDFFWTNHQDDIVNELGDSIQGAFESLMMGAPPLLDPFGEASSKIEEMFSKFLDSKEMDNQVPGVPTKASLGGVSHRFKKKRNKMGSRPSFIDSGLYENSFRCWGES